MPPADQEGHIVPSSVESKSNGASSSASGGERPSAAVAVKRDVVGRLSIKHKLPLLIGALLLAVITAVSAAAYIEARNTAIRTNEARLASVALQLRDIFHASGNQIRAMTRALAARSEVTAFARHRSEQLRPAAVAALTVSGSQADQVMAIELLREDGTRLLSVGQSAIPSHVDSQFVSRLLPWSASRDSVVIGRFRFFGDTIAYPIVAPLPDRSAYVVQWRRLVGSRRTREMMTQLIGSEASIFLGNPSLARWTNLERPVPAPPIDTTAVAVAGIQSYSRPAYVPPGDSSASIATARVTSRQHRYLAAAAPIPGTPWIVAVDFPYDAVVDPVNDFLRRLALIALVMLAIGVAASYAVSRRISQPLVELTDAAVEVAGGNFSRAPQIKRSDELGRLGRAFAAMASEVQGARDDLERKVDLRTRDLNAALRQLHEAQDALVRREKLALLGQLASGVGHELRNPLGVMTNAVYYLKTVLRDQPTTVHEYLEIVQQQITLSEKIVGDLLDFARSKSPQRKPAHLNDIVEAQLGRLGATPGIVIETELPGNLPQVRVDPVQIGQIILNLLTNAVQSINGGGGRIALRASLAGDQVQCEVIDNGVGIARENIDKIFEPLFTTKARGIGLGLAVSRQLARANSGELTVSSTPGQGATFRLWLPVATGGHT